MEVASCYLCYRIWDPNDQCVFKNRQLGTSVSICSQCIEYAIDDLVKNIWYNSDVRQGAKTHLRCPYCSDSILEATYDCVIIKQDVRYTIPMHAGCFEENIGIGL